MGLLSLKDINSILVGACDFRYSYNIDNFQLFQFMFFWLFTAETKFWFIHTLILLWFDLTQVRMDQLEICMLRLHCTKFSCYTSTT